jgi:hypothetical protein
LTNGSIAHAPQRADLDYPEYDVLRDELERDRAAAEDLEVSVCRSLAACVDELKREEGNESDKHRDVGHPQRLLEDPAMFVRVTDQA